MPCRLAYWSARSSKLLSTGITTALAARPDDVADFARLARRQSALPLGDSGLVSSNEISRSNCFTSASRSGVVSLKNGFDFFLLDMVGSFYSAELPFHPVGQFHRMDDVYDSRMTFGQL